MDQDWRQYLLKKFANRATSATTTLHMGCRGLAALSILRPFVAGAPFKAHGVRRDDLARKGWCAADVPSVIRLLTPKCTNALQVWARSTQGAGGIVRYLGLDTGCHVHE
jgi:hypothetical protein